MKLDVVFGWIAFAAIIISMSTCTALNSRSIDKCKETGMQLGKTAEEINKICY